MVVRVYVETVDWSPPAPEPWMELASCLNQDPELFFPENRASTRDAKAVCWNKCSVRLECLAKALHDEKDSTDRRSGVFGGLGPTERKNLQKKLDALKEAS